MAIERFQQTLDSVLNILALDPANCDAPASTDAADRANFDFALVKSGQLPNSEQTTSAQIQPTSSCISRTQGQVKC